MSRRIVTTQLQKIGGADVDTYFDRVVKYIPADIIAAWTTASGLIKAASNVNQQLLVWITFTIGLILTPLWILKQTHKEDLQPAKTQAAIGFFAFAVWVFTLGGPFANLPFYRPIYGSLVLILYTLLVGFIEPKEGPVKHESPVAPGQAA